MPFSFEKLHTSSALTLRQLIQAGELSPLELVESHLGRLHEVEPRVRAVIHSLEAEALEKARAQTQLLKEGEPDSQSRQKPYLGIPFTLKGAFSYPGAPWHVGNWERRELRGETCSTPVQKLLDSGAVPIAVTNIPEALTWIETKNPLTGRTSNPHAPSRTPGGSSGGEAALVAAGASVFGLGTDFGGSLRIPAAFCGITAHKPTGGRIEGGGVWPDPGAGLETFATIGPLARRVEDLFPLLRILSSGRWPEKTPEQISLQETRVFYYTEDGRHGVSREIQASITQAAQALQDQGLRVEKWRPRLLKDGVRIWLSMVEKELDQPFREILGNGKRLSLSLEFARVLLGQPRHSVPALGLAFIEDLLKLTPRANARYAAMGIELRDEIEAKLGHNGALLAPVYTSVAPLHGRPLLSPWDWIYAGIYNALRLPATAVPLGKNEAGLPLGAQIIAARDNDALTLALAGVLERPALWTLPHLPH